MKSKWFYYGVYKSGYFENYETLKRNETFPETFYKSGTYNLQGIFKTEVEANNFIKKQKENSQRHRDALL